MFYRDTKVKRRRKAELKYIKVVIMIAVFTVLTAFLSEKFIPLFGQEKEEEETDPPILYQTEKWVNDYSGFAVNRDLSVNVTVSAQSAILCTGDGTVLFEKQSEVPLPMASITKVMTAVVAIEKNGDLARTFSVPPEAVGVEGSSVYLQAGEQVSIEMLLYSVMLESANDAATALAIATSGSEEEFVREMNSTAKRISMNSTHFCNPHGLSENEHFTTAKDYARLMAYAIKNEVFCKVISTKKAVYKKNDGTLTRVLSNHNRLLNTMPEMIGGKTGYTKASGRTLVTAAEKDGAVLICVTLNAPDDWNDHTSLYRAGFETVKTATFGEEALTCEVPVALGDSTSLSLIPEEAVTFTLSENDAIEFKITVPHVVYAPVSEGTPIGKAEFFCNGIKIGETELIASATAEKFKEKEEKGFFEKIFS